MKPLTLAAAALVLVPALAAADTFGGFGGHSVTYLVGRDRICQPLAVSGGKASGTPSCTKASDAEVAEMNAKETKAVRGKDATHAASSHGRTLEITEAKSQSVIVTWEAADPISKVSALYVGAGAEMIAVEFAVRRGGRDVTEVVAFDMRGSKSGGTTDPVDDPPDRPPVTEAPPETPALKKALKAARKAAKGAAKKAITAWKKVLAIDPDHSEAHYGLALAHMKAKKTDLALGELELLAQSGRPDAIEFLVQARFDKAFAKIRADARFRTATGLDDPNETFYERLMGHGGVWEQEETACENPGVQLTLSRDRSFKLVVSGNCGGDKFKEKFKGTWQGQEPEIVLTVPDQSGSFPCAVAQEDGEDAIRCTDDFFTFVVRPVRR